MKLVNRIVWICCAAFLLQTSPLFADKAQQKPVGLFIGSLKTNEKIIDVLTGSDGPLYTIKSIDGTILAENLTKQQAISQFPEIEAILQKGIADNAKNYNQPEKSPKLDNIDSGLSY